MTQSIEGRLNESLRDALVAYYLNDVVKNHQPLADLDLQGRLKTANDLYEFLLIDTQVTQAVQTSPVASAISSVQQYINGILMGMEPGYETKGPEAHEVAQWRDQKSQYPIWAASQQLAYYPEVYINPNLRLKKSSYFAKLEQALNQNKIHVDTVQNAVLAYLAQFEEVANLSVINGYITTDDFKSGTYYFVGKSRAENTYYWRTVNMADRPYQEGTGGPQKDMINPGAWSDWKKIDIPVSESTVERTIRPVYFNNRLYVIWADWIPLGEDKPYRDADGKFTKWPKSQFRLNLIYKKYDDSWSVPETYIDASAAALSAAAGASLELDSFAFYDSSTQPNKLFLGIYGGYQAGMASDGSKDIYSLLHNIRLDPNFNIEPVFPKRGQVIGELPTTPESTEAYVRKICRLFAHDNKGRFQYRVTRYVGVKSITTISPYPGSSDWNFESNQKNIVDMVKNTHVQFDNNASKLTVKTVNLDIAPGPNQSLKKIVLKGTEIELDLIFESIPVGAGADHYRLTSGSKLLPSTDDFASGGGAYEVFLDLSVLLYFIRDDINSNTNKKLSVPSTESGGTCSLEGKYINKFEADLLFHGIPARHLLLSFLSSPSSCSFWINSITSSASLKEKRFYAFFDRPKNYSTPSDGQVTRLEASSYQSSLPANFGFDHTLPINVETLLPGSQTGVQKDFYLIHGVAAEIETINGGWTSYGQAKKLAKIELEYITSLSGSVVSPKISTNEHPTYGIAEYIDFAGSGAEDSEVIGKRSPIRMNTLFVKELIDKANRALENLLSWECQQIAEPPMGEETLPGKMDFHGANGLYFWELFLHLPFLVSHRLNFEQQFDDADHWLNFIFDPARKADKTGRPDYWQVRPLNPDETRRMSYALLAPVDPDGIASSEPIHYRKAIFFHYIRNLIDRGDQAYRELTPDSLGEAKLWYVRALDLLGPRPDVKLVNNWAPHTLNTLAGSSNIALRDFEISIAQRDQVRVERELLKGTNNVPVIHYETEPLALSKFSPDPTLSTLDSAYFRLPMNAKLVELWDRLESRLFNLRSNRTIDGKALSLPLFAAPLDPSELLARFAQGAGAGGNFRLAAAVTPHYRFNVMLAMASKAVDTLMQFGTTLLSFIERKEQSEFAESQQKDVCNDLVQFVKYLNEQAIAVDMASKTALLKSQEVANERMKFYDKLIQENVTSAERSVLQLRTQARVIDAASSASLTAAEILKVPPNTFGLANGGYRLEGAPQAIAMGLMFTSTIMQSTADSTELSEQWRRRRQEWELARDQAQLEAEQIEKQIAVHDAQAKLTQKQQEQSAYAMECAQKTYEFLAVKRFTKSSLYEWLIGETCAVYRQAYDAVLSLCLAAEASWQYEQADFVMRFVQPGGWRDTYHGLMVGERLKLNLLKMEAAYLNRNERLLEITKTVSLKALKGEEEWAAILDNLLIDSDGKKREGSDGKVTFELDESLFEEDYPGHYLRRIMWVSVSLPAIVGPYQNVRAVLTQSSNCLVIAPDISAVRQLKGLNGGSVLNVKENLRASQQIALSSGLDDNGLFSLNFGDERYLPFEGTGAISKWELSFPNFDSKEQQAMLATLTDIIVHIHYTAKEGGSAFAQAVAALKKEKLH
ncbi:Insecticidal toxin protein [Mycoavidus cysteinexigens]|uniref:Insecticidal toxin protein n=1 Tax=Mycoavidus cysteinexigens TaxID=1553431 RepID=A0A2Z6EYB3_9BURK|nr:neuraminidase-like domain-containing protein [Mycoavidus cysteinexigens]BBE10382.1 Insecticidal toxin protein [Mycoavidus cysteinexigens]GAM53247.1 putative insecticidal toxin complex protein TccB [bacterium endosymbiont of Mortierella elongata FMR23-6]GLR00453.1 toxin [Mycoavidus cysteinexigens]